MSARPLALLFIASGLGGLLTLPLSPRAAAPHVAADDSTCATCHPGAAKGLRQSVHASLLQKPETAAQACTVCHGDLSSHQTAALQPGAVASKLRSQVPAVTAQACATCHADAGYAPAQGSHPWSKSSRGAALPGTTAQDSNRPTSQPSSQPESGLPLLGLAWTGSATAGYRFVDVDGAFGRYKTDVNLDEGWRLTAAELEGTAPDSWLDRVHLRASNIADPYQQVDGTIEKQDRYSAKGRWRKNGITYRATGDYHRVDQKQQESGLTLDYELDADTGLFGSFTRRSEDGFWLTRRIGVRNVTPQTVVQGVESPRRFDSDLGELGLHTRFASADWTAAIEYEDQHDRNQWFYQQPATRNPAFLEQEDFTSRSSLRGPGGRVTMHKQLGELTLDAKGRYLHRRRRIQGAGEQSGYDISDYTTTTEAGAHGHARTWVADGTAAYSLTDNLALIGDLRWVDHQERLNILQTDVTRYPNLSTITTTLTDLQQRTSQRVLEGSLQADFSPQKELTLSLGYGWSREWLRVPDLEAADADFARGTIRSDGILAGIQWRPTTHWQLRSSFRGFGQNGVQLHDVVEDEMRELSASIKHSRQRWSFEIYGKDRRASNDVSRSSTENLTLGSTASLRPQPELDLFVGYVFADIDSRTLTNFYFDPDPAPQPTYVGFQGETHSIILGTTIEPCARVSWRVDGSYTKTVGSFDLALFDLRTDISYKLFERSDAGLMYRYVDYRESQGADLYDASVVFLYWRQRL